MESRRISTYISFGSTLRYLQDARPGQRIHAKNTILDCIDRFLDGLDDFKLPVTRRAAGDLRSFRNRLEKDKHPRLNKTEAAKLAEIIRDLRRTLFAEAQGNIAFIVTEKRIDVNKLLSDMPSLLAPGVFDQLPTLAQYDLNEAGKCIAFERSTAAAFHILRATESVLRHFYNSIVRRNRSEHMWGPMVQSLRQRRKPPDGPLLDNLDNIRKSFRNPTQHPDKSYEIQEVQDLFGLCVDAINRMVVSPTWSR